MISDAVLVDVTAALYAPPDGYFEYGVQTTDGVTWGLHQDSSGANLVVCRGSVTIQDWLRDLESEASRVVPDYPSLGHIPYGFGDGIVEAYEAIKTTLFAKQPLYLLGHSLGAAHAAILAGMFVADQIAVEHVFLCGCPKPGMLPLKTLLSKTSISNYRNGSDPVPDVPVPIVPLLPWLPIAPIKMLNEPPTDANWHGIPANTALAWHNIALYQQGVHAI